MLAFMNTIKEMVLRLFGLDAEPEITRANQIIGDQFCVDCVHSRRGVMDYFSCHKNAKKVVESPVTGRPITIGVENCYEKNKTGICPDYVNETKARQNPPKPDSDEYRKDEIDAIPKQSNGGVNDDSNTTTYYISDDEETKHPILTVEDERENSPESRQ